MDCWWCSSASVLASLGVCWVLFFVFVVVVVAALCCVVVHRLGGFRFGLFVVDCFVNPKGCVQKPERVWFV